MTPATPGLADANALIKRVFDATEHAIENLTIGERISLKGLTERVSAFLALPQSTVSPFVSLWTKNNSDKCTVMKGRKGGIYRGKPVRKEDLVPRCSHCGQKLRAGKGAAAKKQETTPKAA
jgi:hypothetical protein